MYDTYKLITMELTHNYYLVSIVIITLHNIYIPQSGIQCNIKYNVNSLNVNVSQQLTYIDII